MLILTYLKDYQHRLYHSHWGQTIRKAVHLVKNHFSKFKLDLQSEKSVAIWEAEGGKIIKEKEIV